MDIFNRKEIVNFKLLGNLIVELTYNNGSQSTYSNVLWSVNGDGDGSGSLHLSQGGAVGGIGFFGFRVSPETPLIIDGVPYINIDEVDSFLINNMSSSGAILGQTETITNKQNSLELDGEGIKYPTVDAVTSGLDNKQDIFIGNDLSLASELNVGKLKYYVVGNSSYIDMCMQTGVSTYAWTNIVSNTW